MRTRFPRGYKLFMSIAEPRFYRILQFAEYVCLAVVGSIAWFALPHSIENILGNVLAYALVMFVTLGSLLGAVAVLPGIWWLERVGIISLGTGFGIYGIANIAMGTSPLGVGIITALLISFMMRWFEIKDWQLEPKKE